MPENNINKTLVFLHGWGVDSQLWFKIIPFLIDKNYSLYFLDLPVLVNLKSQVKLITWTIIKI